MCATQGSSFRSAFLILALVLLGPTAALGGEFVRGDCNDNGEIDIGDVITVLECLYVSCANCTDCFDVMDANDNGAVQMTDAMWLLNYMFFGGESPPGPFPESGTDGTTDDAYACGDTVEDPEPEPDPNNPLWWTGYEDPESCGSTKVEGDPYSMDRFGQALATGDFDGDGTDDLAIGSPGSEYLYDGSSEPSPAFAGAVNVLYGARWTGLELLLNQRLEPDTDTIGLRFGYALAVGDFDADGYDDLVVGVPGYNKEAGAVEIYYGTSSGLDIENRKRFTQNELVGTAESKDRLGFSLAAADFDGNGYDDLAIGVPYENQGSTVDSGVVNVMYGGAAGLTSAGDELFRQGKGNIPGGPEEDDYFGRALAAGDFDGDGYFDLAVGVPGETDENDIGPYDNETSTGRVNMLYGSDVGLIAGAGRDRSWDQDDAGVPGANEDYDRFGWALASGDFDADGYDDLAIGVPHEDIDIRTNAGAVTVIYGGDGGLDSEGAQLWRQGSYGLEDDPESYDHFGFSLTTGDFDGDGVCDLAVGVPREELAEEDPINTGAVQLLFGHPADAEWQERENWRGLSPCHSYWWDQRDQELESSPILEDNFRFGHALAAGDFDGDGTDDIAVGVPGTEFSDPQEAQSITLEQTGAVNVIDGRALVDEYCLMFRLLRETRHARDAYDTWLDSTKKIDESGSVLSSFVFEIHRSAISFIDVYDLQRTHDAHPLRAFMELGWSYVSDYFTDILGEVATALSFVFKAEDFIDDFRSGFTEWVERDDFQSTMEAAYDAEIKLEISDVEDSSKVDIVPRCDKAIIAIRDYLYVDGTLEAVETEVDKLRIELEDYLLLVGHDLDPDDPDPQHLHVYTQFSAAEYFMDYLNEQVALGHLSSTFPLETVAEQADDWFGTQTRVISLHLALVSTVEEFLDD